MVKNCIAVILLFLLFNISLGKEPVTVQQPSVNEPQVNDPFNKNMERQAVVYRKGYGSFSSKVILPEKLTCKSCNGTTVTFEVKGIRSILFMSWKTRKVRTDYYVAVPSKIEIAQQEKRLICLSHCRPLHSLSTGSSMYFSYFYTASPGKGEIKPPRGTVTRVVFRDKTGSPGEFWPFRLK